MPIITIEITRITKEEKARLAEEFTKAASDITGIPKSSFTIIIHELEWENFGIGGTLLSDSKLGP